MKKTVVNSKLPESRPAKNPSRVSQEGKNGSVGDVSGPHFKKICCLLKLRSGVDFSHYKTTTLRRRIVRRCQLKRFSAMAEYISFLAKEPAEVDELFNDLLINVTGFFRDPQAFQALKKNVFPALVKGKQSGADIRVWVPGCATGEEAYSLAICLCEELKARLGEVRIQIFGTDLSEQAIAKARSGIYPATIASEVSAERLQRYFVKTKRGYQVSQTIRGMCTFAAQNICQDPPFSRIDLVSCRNVLIYLGPALQQRVLPIFHYALKPGGTLLLGPSETVGCFADLFLLMDKKQKIYTKKPTSIPVDLPLGTLTPRIAAAAEAAKNTAPKASPRGIPKENHLQSQIDELLMNHYAPCGVVVDSNMEVLQFRGNTGRFLQHAAGSASLNLLQLAHSSLAIDLRTTIHKAFKSGSPTHKAGVRIKDDGQVREIALHAIPLDGADQQLLVLFEEQIQPASRLAGMKNGDKPGEVELLRSELEASKESLQAIIEELEASNEELKSANEEIESSVEELQSTNEELQTAKEELQSTNEELTTLNEELNARNLEMAKLNDDLSNLLSSISVPIVMVDNALIVRRITPQARKHFNLIPSDVSRRFTDLKPNLVGPDLEKMLAKVIEDLAPQEAEVVDSDGRWHSLRIRPYRTKENKIDGAVMALVDIHDVKQSIGKLEKASEFSNAIVDSVNQPILVLDSSLRVRKANRAYYENFQTDERNTEGLLFHNLGCKEFKNPKLRTLLEDVLPLKNQFNGFEIRQKNGAKEERSFVINARKLESHSEELILVFIEPRGSARE